jgi:parvulin-like peptidyl-prolyl isomerase
MHKISFYLSVVFNSSMNVKKFAKKVISFQIINLCFCQIILCSVCTANKAIIAAKVGKEVITNVDIDSRCKMIALFAGKENDVQFMNNIRLQVIQKLIDESCYEQLAVQFKIDIGQDNVNDYLEDYAKSFGFERTVFIELTKKHGVYNSLVSMIRARLIMSYIVMSALQKELTRISEKQINKEIERIKTNEKKVQYSVLEIVFNSKGKVEAKEAAEKAYSELIRQSEREPAIRVFQTLAQQLSQSSTSQDGGYIGWVVDGQLDEVSSQTIKSLDVGTFSKPIRIRSGEYRIFFLNDIKQPGFAPYSETQIELLFVSIPFNESKTKDEQRIIQSQLDALRTSNSEKEFCGIAVDFGLEPKRVTRTLDNVPKIIASAEIGKCVHPFFSGN